MRSLLAKIPEPDGRADIWCGAALPPRYSLLSSAPGEAWFVDGGNAGIIDAPHFTLQKLRAVAVHYPTKQVIKRECIVLLTTAGKEWTIHREDGTSEVLRTDEFMEAVTLARQQLEHAVAREALAACSGAVVLDGDVAPESCYALQKSITVLTSNGFPLSSVLTATGPWAAPLGTVLAVKLDNRARHVFLLHGADNVNHELLPILVYYSRDLLFPGYPGGLILADKLARVSNDEAEALKITARSLQRDLRGRIDRAQASTDSHTILDSM